MKRNEQGFRSPDARFPRVVPGLADSPGALIPSPVKGSQGLGVRRATAIEPRASLRARGQRATLPALVFLLFLFPTPLRAQEGKPAGLISVKVPLTDPWSALVTSAPKEGLAALGVAIAAAIWLAVAALRRRR